MAWLFVLTNILQKFNAADRFGGYSRKSSGRCFFIVLVMISYPKIKTVSFSGYLYAFVRAKSFFPNLKLSTEHHKLFSGFREMSCDSFLPQTGSWRKKKNTTKIIQSSFKAWSCLHSSTNIESSYTGVMIPDLRIKCLKLERICRSETRRMPPLQNK